MKRFLIITFWFFVAHCRPRIIWIPVDSGPEIAEDSDFADTDVLDVAEDALDVVDVPEDVPADVPPDLMFCDAASCSRVLQIVTNGFSCALVQDRSVFCWGANYYGQLGNGGTSSQPTPSRVLGLDNVDEIYVGNQHACALLMDGTVRCWGNNQYGQLGFTTPLTCGNANCSVVAMTVPSLANVTSMALGSAHTCVLLMNGTVQCWGINALGQLGDGTVATRTAPTPVSNLSNVTQIASGPNHVCALLGDGSVRCWGDNIRQALGYDTRPPTISSTPRNVTGLPFATQISLGGNHTCARLSDMTVRCWGDNFSGQLGDGTTTAQPAPVSVAGLTGVLSVSAGSSHTCALTGQELRCWGGNSAGQLGIDSRMNQLTPAIVMGLSAAEVSAGSSTTCARDSNSAAYCWGWNQDGQVGDGTRMDRSLPVPVQF